MKHAASINFRIKPKARARSINYCTGPRYYRASPITVISFPGAGCIFGLYRRALSFCSFAREKSKRQSSDAVCHGLFTRRGDKLNFAVDVAFYWKLISPGGASRPAVGFPSRCAEETRDAFDVGSLVCSDYRENIERFHQLRVWCSKIQWGMNVWFLFLKVIWKYEPSTSPVEKHDKHVFGGKTVILSFLNNLFQFTSTLNKIITSS